jgi:predicted RNA binding protein YcfA (HicA-like mRNA interferase family)
LPKQPRLTAPELEARLLKAGFTLIRSKGSHRIYQRGASRVVVPLHGQRTLHPKIVRQALDLIGSDQFS